MGERGQSSGKGSEVHYGKNCNIASTYCGYWLYADYGLVSWLRILPNTALVQITTVSQDMHSS
jgi:hypothetical protein